MRLTAVNLAPLRWRFLWADYRWARYASATRRCWLHLRNPVVSWPAPGLLAVTNGFSVRAPAFGERC